MNMKTSGQRILQRRKELQMNQRQLGKAAGVSYATISLWESDKTEPSGKNLHNVCRVLQCSPTWILFGDDDQLPAQPIPSEAEAELTTQEAELLSLFRALPESEQLAQLRNLRGTVSELNNLFEEMLKARKLHPKK